MRVSAAHESARRRGAELPEVQANRVAVRGVELRVLTAGSGWPLVLLHGIAGSAHDLAGVLPRFGRRYRAIAADAPGHGLSDKPAGPRYDVSYYTDSTLALLDALGIQRAPLLAVSGGGAVALSIALAHPDRVSKLVLVDAAGLGREVSWSYRVASLPLVRFAVRRASRRSIEAFGRGMCYHPDRLPPGWVEHRQRVWASPGAFAAYDATVRAGLSLRGQKVVLSPWLSQVRQPTLLVWGRQDRIIPVAHALAAQRAMPNAQLHIFERCGHMPPWEYPDEFAQVVLDFLS